MSRIDPLWHALSKLRRGKYEECIAICDEMLANNPHDQVGKCTLLNCLRSEQFDLPG